MTLLSAIAGLNSTDEVYAKTLRANIPKGNQKQACLIRDSLCDLMNIKKTFTDRKRNWTPFYKLIVFFLFQSVMGS